MHCEDYASNLLFEGSGGPVADGLLPGIGGGGPDPLRMGTGWYIRGEKKRSKNRRGTVIRDHKMFSEERREQL